VGLRFESKMSIRFNMDDSTVRAGPIRRLRDRASLCDYSPSTYQSRVVSGISDLEAPIVSFIQHNQRALQVAQHSEDDDSTSTAIYANGQPKAATVRAQRARTADGT